MDFEGISLVTFAIGNNVLVLDDGPVEDYLADVGKDIQTVELVEERLNPFIMRIRPEPRDKVTSQVGAAHHQCNIVFII